MKESHFYQALKQVAGCNPPEFMKTVTVDQYCFHFGDTPSDLLHTWAVDKSNLPWGTGMGVIDAAIAIVKDAVDNGNIDESTLLEQGLCLRNGDHMFIPFGTPAIRRCNWCGCKEGEENV